MRYFSFLENVTPVLKMISRIKNMIPNRISLEYIEETEEKHIYFEM